MADALDVAIIGAGPFGLSVAAHLSHLRTRVFGKPMSVWREQMPPDMQLRSSWKHTSLSAPEGQGTIDAWTDAAGVPREGPIALTTFLRYADWFRDHYVAESDPADIVAVDANGGGYRLRSATGDEFDARTVVVAVGVTPFLHAPPVFGEVTGDGVEFAVASRDYTRLRGRRVVVVGGGQSGLECAGLAAREAADVELIVRSPIRWFADREPYHDRGAVGNMLYNLAYPVVGFGPPPINRIARHPDLFAALPIGARQRINRRLMRPGGSPWLRSLVDGKVKITEGRSVDRLERLHSGSRLALDDGTDREVDVVLLATGYRFSLERLAFLSPELRARVKLEGDRPRLDRFFRSTDPGLLFVGYAAEEHFGPLSRFVMGTVFTAHRVASGLGAPPRRGS
jgi:FAD-dependent urate hydroxylase